jgi:hypothetical protein
MSRILINRYLADLDRTKRFSGSLTEEVIREAFKGLLRGTGGRPAGACGAGQRGNDGDRSRNRGGAAGVRHGAKQGKQPNGGQAPAGVAPSQRFVSSGRCLT